MRWTTLPSALAIVISLSACGAPPPIIDEPVNTAKDLIDSGDPDAAIAKLRTIERLSDGLPSQQVSYHLTLATALLHLGYVNEPAFLIGDPTDPSVIKERERSIEAAQSKYVDARREFARANALLPIRDEDGRTREQDARDQYETLLGTGQTYLREGILLGEPQWFAKAQDYFEKCERLAPSAGLAEDQDARLIFARARRFQSRNGELTGPKVTRLFRDLDTFQKNQKQSGFSVHVAYRDMLDYVRRYDTPRKVEGILEEPGDPAQAKLHHDVTDQLIGWLAEYEAARPELPALWGRFDQELTDFFNSHRDWTKRRHSADRILAEANDVTSQTDADVTALTKMITQLDQIDEEFRGSESEEFGTLYRRALVDCVNKLLLDASGNMELKSESAYSQALVAAESAKRYASSDQLAESKSEELRARCDNAANQIRGHQAFNQLEKKVWGVLQREGAEQAVQALEALAQNRDLLTNPTYTAEIDSLRTAITEKSVRYREATQLLAQIDQVDVPSDKLELANQLQSLVELHGLEKLRGDSVRKLRDAQIDNSDFADALATMNQIQNPTPTDQMAIGLCNFERKNYDIAAAAFDKVKPNVVANSRYGLQALRAGGESLLNTKKHEESYQYFSKLLEVNQEANRQDSSVELRLIDCCKFELQRSLPTKESRKWRLRWLEHNPRDFDNRKELMREAYALGKEAHEKQDPDSDRYFRDAYDHLRFYLKNRGYDGLSLDDKKLADRLYASYADYAPLEEGVYVYVNEADGVERREERKPLSSSSRDEAMVFVSVAGTKLPKQRWIRSDDKLFRGPELRPLLISIPNPEETNYSDTWGNQRIEVADFGQEFQHGGNRYQHCLIVRVYGSGSDKTKYFEYTLAPDVGIVREVNAASATRDTYVLQLRR